MVDFPIEFFIFLKKANFLNWNPTGNYIPTFIQSN